MASNANLGGGSPYNPRNTQLTRLPTSILNTPQSITVVPQQLIQDQKASNVTEALRNVPGVSFFGGEGGTQGDNINIHGYSARNDFYRDGIRDPGWYTRDTFSVESVTVLKGPSSFLFGRGSTGGAVNLTSKLPIFADFATAEIGGQTSPGARSTIDVNRTFGDFAARMVVLGMDADVAGRDIVHNRRYGVAPSLTWKIAPDTRATISYIYQHDNNIPDYGIPLLPGSYFGTPYGQPAPVPKNTFYGTAYDREIVDAHIATAKIEHDINNDWKFTNATRYSNIDRFVSIRGTQISATNLYGQPTGGAPLATLPPGYNLYNLWVQNSNYFQNHTTNTLLTNQSDVTGKFYTGPLLHTFAAGVELSQETRDNLRSTYTGPFDRVNVGNPNPYPAVLGNLPPNSGLTQATGNGVGVYANDMVTINKYFDLMAGIRYDRLNVKQFSANVNTFTGAVTGPTNAATPYNVENKVSFTSWRAGAAFHPVQNSTIYAMYGTSFDPSSEYLTITGGQQNLPPTTNETYELGAKYDMLDNKLSLTAALFRVTQNNAIETVNQAAGIYQQVGKTRVQGFEFGIAGKLTDKWSVFGGYSYMESKVLDSAISQTTGTFVAKPGNQLANVPKNTFSFTTNYDITREFSVGGSAFFVDSRFTNAANTGWVPSYWRFDAMAKYKVNKYLQLQLNVLNIADTKNFESLSGFGAAQPGPGRTAILTAKISY